VPDPGTLQKQAPASDPPPITAPRRIMVADDEHLVAMGIATSLKAVGFEVCGPATDGQAAIELARADQPDLALLDIRMPQKDGLACAAAIWNELEIPAIILSAYSSPQYVDEAQRIGVFGYLLKPITGEALRATINVAWSRAMMQIEQKCRIGQLEQTLAVRRTVELAKWRLIEHRRMTESEAHALLQRTARNERRRLADLADEILKRVDHPLLKTG
jgi:response regulator NasT